MWSLHALSIRRLTFSGFHDVISQKIQLFITTAVRISNPARLISEDEISCAEGKITYTTFSALGPTVGTVDKGLRV
jgi:hypothetical protein